MPELRALQKPVLDRIARDEALPAVGRVWSGSSNDTSVVGASVMEQAVRRKRIAGLTFDVDGEALGIEATLNPADGTGSREKREAGAQALADMFRGAPAALRAGAQPHWPRKRRSRIAGASLSDPAGRPPPRQPRRAPRSSRPCATPSSPAYPRACRIAITRSRPSGWDWTRCRSGTVTPPFAEWKRPRIVPWDEARKIGHRNALAGLPIRGMETGTGRAGFFTSGRIDAGVQGGKEERPPVPLDPIFPPVTDVAIPSDSLQLELTLFGKPAARCHDGWPMKRGRMGVHQPSVAARQGPSMLSSTPLTLAETRQRPSARC